MKHTSAAQAHGAPQYAPLPALSRPLLMVVADTEEDFDWTKPFSTGTHGFSSMQRIPQFQSLCDRWGIRPTYVVDYPIASRAGHLDELRAFVQDGRCNIGSQLHPWVSPPLIEHLDGPSSFPGNLPPELEREKLLRLTEAILENLGVAPLIYKAGRYGIGPNTSRFLDELEYRVDMSVRPRYDYRAEGGPDFRFIMPKPYWLPAANSVLEIPLTSDYYGLFDGLSPRLYSKLCSPAGHALHLPGIFARLGLLNRVSLSPEGNPLDEAKRLTRKLVREGVEIFTVAFHTPSLEPGNTPYVRSEREAKALIDWFEGYFAFFFGEVNGQASTPLDVWALARADSSQRHTRSAAYGTKVEVSKSAASAPRLLPETKFPSGPLTGMSQIKPCSLPRIPVLLCVDAGYVQHAAVCLVSLLEHNPRFFFDIVIVTTATTFAEDGNKLRHSLAGFSNQTLQMKTFDRALADKFPIVTQHLAIECYTRLWVAEFFPNTIPRVLYLDSDMIVVGDIGELWNVEPGDWLVAAVDIPWSDRGVSLGIPEGYGYFNSGVLLIDLDRWREEKILELLLSYIAANPEKIIDADQDVLNACLYGRRLRLPSTFNVISPFFARRPSLGLSGVELRAILDDARIVHFNGASKPWSYLCRHPRASEYLTYLVKTEWRDFRFPDRTAINFVKKHVGSRISPHVRRRLKVLCGLR